MSRRTAGLLGAAAAIGAVTVVARVVGFGRWLVFSDNVGATCTGAAYATANQLPNVLFEVVAGGALAAAVVPLLSGPLSRGDREQADRTASALLGWALVVLVPVSLLLALAAGPLIDLLPGVATGHCSGVEAAAARMLVVFAPQVALYGVGIVLTGVLQAHRRFVAPALAPLLSSLVVIAAYVAFGAMVDGKQNDLAALPRSTELVLTLGTTLGVVALSLPMLLPAHRAGVRWTPTLRFPPGVARRAALLAGAGVATLLAQQASVVAVLAVSNARGGAGVFNVYQYLQAVYVLPYAVLAVPLATSAFPRLAEAHARGDRPSYDGTLARSTRAVLLVSAAGAAVLAGVAPAVEAFFGAIDAGGPQAVAGMGAALAAFAPGLVGFALVAHLGRALYAEHRQVAATVPAVAGWLVVAGGSVLAAVALGGGAGPERARGVLLGLGLGSTAGMTVAGVGLVVAVVRSRGGQALRGAARTAVSAGFVGLVAVSAGRRAVDAVLPAGPSGLGRSLLAGVLGALACVVVLAVGLLPLERGTLRAVLRRGRTPSQDGQEVRG